MTKLNMTIRLNMAAMLAGIIIGSMGAMPAANAVVIDFDSAPLGQFQTADYFEDGFRMQRVGGAGHYDIFGTDGNNYLNIDITGGLGSPSTVMFDFFGAPFDLLSLDIVAGISGPATLTTSMGGMVNYGVLPSPLPVTEIFGPPALFTNLTSFQISTTGPGIAFDNINLLPSQVAKVTEPASILLLGLGLAGIALGWRQPRRQNT